LLLLELFLDWEHIQIFGEEPYGIQASSIFTVSFGRNPSVAASPCTTADVNCFEP
jgi:hypothetical protein